MSVGSGVARQKYWASFAARGGVRGGGGRKGRGSGTSECSVIGLEEGGEEKKRKVWKWGPKTHDVQVKACQNRGKKASKVREERQPGRPLPKIAKRMMLGGNL